jgi:hypothetical protein
MMVLTFSTALYTLLPKLILGLWSLNYNASYFPVDAPDGTLALNLPKDVVT